jgi:hypothetical protein
MVQGTLLKRLPTLSEGIECESRAEEHEYGGR